ncbi:MAG: hypothetical protein SGILL_008223 [Bacillariaceae sp.]
MAYETFASFPSEAVKKIVEAYDKALHQEDLQVIDASETVSVPLRLNALIIDMMQSVAQGESLPWGGFNPADISSGFGVPLAEYFIRKRGLVIKLIPFGPEYWEAPTNGKDLKKMWNNQKSALNKLAWEQCAHLLLRVVDTVGDLQAKLTASEGQLSSSQEQVTALQADVQDKEEGFITMSQDLQEALDECDSLKELLGAKEQELHGTHRVLVNTQQELDYTQQELALKNGECDEWRATCTDRDTYITAKENDLTKALFDPQNQTKLSGETFLEGGSKMNFSIDNSDAIQTPAKTKPVDTPDTRRSARTSHRAGHQFGGSGSFPQPAFGRGGTAASNGGDPFRRGEPETSSGRSQTGGAAYNRAARTSPPMRNRGYGGYGQAYQPETHSHPAYGGAYGRAARSSPPMGNRGYGGYGQA